MSVHKASRKFCAFISFLTVFSTFSFYSTSISNPFMKRNFNDVKRAISEQTELWNNVDKIDDGGVYFIKSASNNNLVWDMPNSNFNDGTAPILYGSNGWGNQRFIVHKQAKYNGKTYYTISPLYSSSSTLKINNKNDNEELKLGKDNNTSLDNFLSNKFIIEKSSYGYTISTGVSTFGKYIIPKDSKLTQNNTLVQKTVSNASTNINYQWYFCKTDTLGNDLQNKIHISGKTTQYFNLTPPSTGYFIIETLQCGYAKVDTYLELYNSSGTRLALNDDISSSSNRYSRITYNFTSLDDVQIRVRGYNASDIGYVYLTLRPKNALYFAGVYDFDKNNNDRPGSLENVKPYFQDYYIEVQRNRGKYAILETAPNGRKKINCEYFVFSGHGYSNAAGVEFYDGLSIEGFGWNEIPSLSGTKMAIWMTCHGARNYFKYGSFGQMTSMAYQSVANGADYSLAYVGSIYDTTQRAFPENFFEALEDGYSIPDAVDKASEWVKGDNWWYWTFFGQFNDDFKNPILYKKGDSLKSSCGDGTYDDDKKKSKNQVMSVSKNIVYVDNTYEINAINVDDEEVETMLMESSDYDVPYVFKTNYKSQIYELGFEADRKTGKVTYYNLTTNTEISSNEFENMMGEPTQAVQEATKDLNLG